MAGETKIILTTITCKETSEPRSDEVYIKYSIDGKRADRYPLEGYHAMSDESTWTVGLPLTFKDTAIVELLDNDGISDDSLGVHIYKPSAPQPETVTVSNNSNGAEYTLSTVTSDAETS